VPLSCIPVIPYFLPLVSCNSLYAESANTFPQHRNMDPTTTLVHPITSDNSTNKGVLAISSHSIHLLSAASADSHPLLTLRLAGLPTAIVHVKGSMWALADSMAGLHLLDLHQPCSLLQLAPQIPLTVAHVLCCVPGSDADMGTSQCCVSVTPCVMLTIVALKVLLCLASEQSKRHQCWMTAASAAVLKSCCVHLKRCHA